MDKQQYKAPKSTFKEPEALFMLCWLKAKTSPAQLENVASEICAKPWRRLREERQSAVFRTIMNSVDNIKKVTIKMRRGPWSY